MAKAWKNSHFIREIIFPYDHQPTNSSPCFTYVYVDIGFSRGDIATTLFLKVEPYKIAAIKFTYVILHMDKSDLVDQQKLNIHQLYVGTGCHLNW